MTNELVGRFDAPTAQRIAPAAELAILSTPSVLVEILPPVRHHLGRFVGPRVHPSEPAKHGDDFAQIKPRHRRFHPFQSLHRGAVLRFGDLVDVWRTGVIIEHLARLWKQRLDVFPYPFGAIGDYT